MEIGASFPFETRKKYVDNKIKKGLIVKKIIRFDFPPKLKIKKCILVGRSIDFNQVKYLIINSVIPKFAESNAHIKPLYIKITPSDYAELDHDSYINCFEIETEPLNDFLNELYANPSSVRELVSCDLLNIIERTIMSSRFANNRDKNIIKSWK